MKRLPLSPSQSAAFAMGRTLLVFDVWHTPGRTALNVELAMLVDFAMQHPRSVLALVPNVDAVIRAYGLQKHDLSDAFAVRHFGITRERFLGVLASLLARDLIADVSATVQSDHLAMTITDAGRVVARQFSSPLSFALRAICTVLCDAWKRRNVRDLSVEIRRALPDDPEFAAALRAPFAAWLIEAE